MFTVKQAAKIVDVSEHTLRFWDKSGFFPLLKRNDSNVRMFSESDLNWIKIVKCLRSVGVSNVDIKRYIDLCLIGDSTISDRYEIIKSTKQKAMLQMEELQMQLDLLNYKEKYYQDLIKNQSKDLWNPAID